ncbi:MAG: nucleotidyltransferase domain-containing protein [Dehalococcoidia bacterium]|nr:MAG: nucleotidyltransferase domain-containing protein [bacterium]MCE7927042.1 nucleotidyltransferase domain-containing protein [Chloroflexi bacterium CFX7]MCK6563349.1 nucleotidyltransferase domain-containing protein [Dehalococcoidia bacterium]NUQ55857.1 nucleotidyltransferase domain-containing protein [Dehalococcoidia bacterium]RIL03670.1 MAG: nucleotidyltransferase domain-containing protein [bacterium]
MGTGLPADLIEPAREALDAEPSLVAAYLFGSFARGTPSAESDLDIAVLFPGKADPRLGGALDSLRDAVERACSRPCDLIDARAASADLFHRVLRDGRLLVDRDPSARIAFEVARRNEYFDLLPYLRQYRRHGAA